MEFDVRLKNSVRIRDARFDEFLAARRKKDEAKNLLDHFFRIKQEAYAAMTAEANSVSELASESSRIWDEYHQVRDNNDAKIKFLVVKANDKHQRMKESFERGNQLFEAGSADAELEFAKAHAALKERNLINDEVKKIIAETQTARKKAERTAPVVDKTRLFAKKEAFEDAKKAYEEALDIYRKAKDEMFRCREKYDDAYIDVVRLKKLKKFGNNPDL